jgi:hypothetical protein
VAEDFRRGERWRAPLDRNGVPQLAVADKTRALFQRHQEALLDEEQETELLTGHVVLMDIPEHAQHGGPDVAIITIGGSTLHEAATEVVGAYDGSLSARPPEWVASTREDLAKALAEHYGCPAVPFSEVAAR